MELMCHNLEWDLSVFVPYVPHLVSIVVQFFEDETSTGFCSHASGTERLHLGTTALCLMIIPVCFW